MSDEKKITIHECGPSTAQCKCRCTPEKRDCEHVWDGEPLDEGTMWSRTCSRCGMSAMEHDLWCAP